jgi:glycosyltransferase involved in cell wall biosynthesis
MKPNQTADLLPMAAEVTGVTVLVRTMDRPTLRRAVLSALEQEGVVVSVVIVAAHGGALRNLGDLRKDCRIQVVEPGTPLSRAAAANACLSMVVGGLALFLDDDDWLLPGHLVSLSQALQAQPFAMAASTGVQCLGGDPQSPVLRHVFEGRADRAAMQLQNALPIHAVLFRMQDDSLRFDEGLEHFEDWDFWLRLLVKGDFVHVQGVTAVYWLDDGAGSGHSSAGPKRDLMLSRFAERRLQQWTSDDVLGLIARDAAQSQRLVHQQQLNAARLLEVEKLAADAQSLQSQVDEARAAGDAARAEVASQGALLKACQSDLAAHRRELTVLELLRVEHLSELERLRFQISSIRQSTSWRITQPLRTLGGLVQSQAHRGWLMRLRQVAALGRSVLNRHGVAGVVLRLPKYVGRSLALLSRPAQRQGTHARISTSPQPRLHPELIGSADTLEAMVSVVIPTLNGGQELALLVRKLLCQEGVRQVEVVLVDSGSTDGSPDTCEALGARVVSIQPQEFSHSYARNLGAEHARGDILLFMVQDAYPIGDLWIHALLRFLLDKRTEGVVAASCAEYPRSDSDMMYDCGVATHYQFLGCQEEDRIGNHVGDDHMSLRSMGQLSDVACMIPRDLFLKYRYRGDYAEDLDLGIRLIKDGLKVAMLASVKVVHSHNRPSWYYLKRSFVDVVFLVGLFDDFERPACQSIHGLVAGVRQVACEVSAWLPGLSKLAQGSDLGVSVSAWIEAARRWSAPASKEPLALGDSRLEAFIAQIAEEAGAVPRSAFSARADAQAQRDFIDAFLARLDHFNRYASSVYGPADARLCHEYSEAIVKTLAATIGASLAYWVLDQRQLDAGVESSAQRQWAERLFTLLKSGV